MDIQTVTVELLRAGPRYNQLISPITQYLGICGDSPASHVTLPYEHGELERRLQELRYSVIAEDGRQRTCFALEQIGREIAQLLSRIDGVAGLLNPTQDRSQSLIHLRIVLSASELAMLPFEASKVPTVTGTASGWLALQSRTPICITRHIRSASAEARPWPNNPKILFITGPETPADKHCAAIETALKRWRDLDGSVSSSLIVLEQPKVADISKIFSDAALKGAPFTHVHVLAHGEQIDDTDRYSPIGLVLNGDEGPVSGERLASALIAIIDAGTFYPNVVTLASCESARQVDVHSSEVSIAHALHARGIPLVVASQFPLTVEGSVPFVARFYEGQLCGEHPFVSIYALRLDLHSRMGPDMHDWASIVVYEALTSDHSKQLEEVCYWQARRALEGALMRLEAIAGSEDTADQLTVSSAEAIVEVDQRIAELPYSGSYLLECAGLRAAAHKRIAQVAFELAISIGLGPYANMLIEKCRQRINDARSEYWRATKIFLTPSSEMLRSKANLHWLLVQVISLDVVLGEHLDIALLKTASLAAEIGLESEAVVDRAWAYVSLTEISLLRLSEKNLQESEREELAKSAFENARRFIECVGLGSEHAATTSRQFARYVNWWGNPQQQSLLTKLGIPERPHWYFNFGLVPTAIKLVDMLSSHDRQTKKHRLQQKQVLITRSKGSIATVPINTTKVAATLKLSRLQADVTFSVEMLPAENGDCLLVEYGDDENLYRILVDCGAMSTVQEIERRLSKICTESIHPFELFVLTHIDSDHIAGVLSMFNDQTIPISFGDIWFNGWRQIRPFLSVRQGEAFSRLLEDPARKLIWNNAFTGKDDMYPGPVTLDESLSPRTIRLPGGMQLTLLSPGPEQLKLLGMNWHRTLLELDPKKAEILARRRMPKAVKDLERFELEPLADAPVRADTSYANGSSIALLAEYGGRSVLLTGDAHANVLVNSIRALQHARGCNGERLKIDALKLSHHGSQNATTIPLLQVLDCTHYLVSTNGNIFYHPDREAIARVILYGGAAPTLHFNYRSQCNTLWDSEVLKKRYNYMTQYPAEGRDGLRVDLGKPVIRQG